MYESCIISYLRFVRITSNSKVSTAVSDLAREILKLKNLRNLAVYEHNHDHAVYIMKMEK